jgi:iron complex outermembrane receptor protein
MQNSTNVKHVLTKIMKVSFTQLILVFLIVGNSLAHKTHGQYFLERNVSLKLQDKVIHEVLAQLEKTAEVKFIYSPKLIQADRKVTLVAQNERLSEVLNRFF